MVKNRHGTGYKMLILLFGILLFGYLNNPQSVQGKGTAADGTKVLVVFSSLSGEIDEDVRLLDLLISHFSANLQIKNSKQVQEEDLAGISHLFYYGLDQEQLPSSFLKLLPSYTGIFVAIGYNAEQFTRHFSFLKLTGIKSITEVWLTANEARKITVEPQNIMKVVSTGDTKVLIEAKNGDRKFPLFLKHQKNYYYATVDLFPPFSNFLAEALHELFEVDHLSSTQAYLRLEDIHPGLDPENVIEIAGILEQRKVSYMVSVIPVYVNPETEEEYHFSDNPELVEALKYMQDHGGSIILHGNTDQYGTAETGDGFEFWNKETNSPISQNPDEPSVIKSRGEFRSQLEYETSLYDQKTFETAYIKNKLDKGIEELVEYGLYPLAFEAPHYAMSQNGYEVLAQYFSTYVGQVQLTDKDWRKMTETPYISSPTFLHGMTLLPETIRYVRYEDPLSIQEMKARLDDFTIVRDGVIGGFYHPFLGGKELIEVLNEIEKVSNLEWLDLKKVENTVQTDTVKIKSENSKIIVDVKRHQDRVSPIATTFKMFLFTKDNLPWILAGAALTIFMTGISYMLLRRIYRIRN